MLGCHDFCGHYDWTFHFVRRQWGPEAVARFWAQAIGGESQQHYAAAGAARGLAGLYDTWTQTGNDEHCDWTFTLDAARNMLRWDMRQCPSKGFLIAHDLHADEDYCDHCIGWMGPLLETVGVELVVHQHNHCGQCWGIMRMKDQPVAAADVACDIRRDPRWNQGFLDCWTAGRKQPVAPDESHLTDACDVIAARLAAAEDLLLVCRDDCPSDGPLAENLAAAPGVVMTAAAYCHPATADLRPQVVVVAGEAELLEPLARRFAATPRPQRPLLVQALFPRQPPLDFVSQQLPRPVPLLPLLIRRGVYVHRPGEPVPPTDALLPLLAAALEKPVRRVAG